MPNISTPSQEASSSSLFPPSMPRNSTWRAFQWEKVAAAQCPTKSATKTILPHWKRFLNLPTTNATTISIGADPSECPLCFRTPTNCRNCSAKSGTNWWPKQRIQTWKTRPSSCELIFYPFDCLNQFVFIKLPPILKWQLWLAWPPLTISIWMSKWDRKWRFGRDSLSFVDIQ